MIHPSVQNYFPEVIKLCKKHKVKRAYVFGSVLTPSFTDSSDIDFLVDMSNNLEPIEMGEHLWSLTYELEDLFKRHVDLLTQRSLKNPYFIEELSKTKFLVYEQ